MTQDDRAVMAAYTIVFDGLTHLGPGDASVTRRVLARVRTGLPEHPRVADLGCGVGASALVLAESIPGAHLLAVDTHPPFIERLRVRARTCGLEDRITAEVGDMAAPPALDGKEGRFDLIWSESAVYGLGRQRSFDLWSPLLAPGGVLVFSDIVWNRDPDRRSARAVAFWSAEYPDIADVDGVVTELTAARFQPLEPTIAGREAWSNYYEPLRARLGELRERADASPALAGLVTGFEREIDQYDDAGSEVALVFFAAHV